MYSASPPVVLVLHESSSLFVVNVLQMVAMVAIGAWLRVVLME